MGPYESKVCFCAVIKLPESPAIRVMAFITHLTERAFMDILGLMAGQAVLGRATKGAGHMALFASH